MWPLDFFKRHGSLSKHANNIWCEYCSTATKKKKRTESNTIFYCYWFRERVQCFFFFLRLNCVRPNASAHWNTQFSIITLNYQLVYFIWVHIFVQTEHSSTQSRCMWTLWRTNLAVRSICLCDCCKMHNLYPLFRSQFENYWLQAIRREPCKFENETELKRFFFFFLEATYNFISINTLLLPFFISIDSFVRIHCSENRLFFMRAQIGYDCFKLQFIPFVTRGWRKNLVCAENYGKLWL